MSQIYMIQFVYIFSQRGDWTDMFTLKKRLWAVMAVLLLLTTGMAVPSHASAAGDSCGENLTWSLDNGTLTISGTGDMWDYTENQSTWDPDTPWYSSWDQITAIVVEEGVTSIGNFAFSKLWCVTSLTLPDSLTRLGDNSLASLTGLTGELTFSAGLQEFGYRALAGCGLTEVTIQNPDPVLDDQAVGYAWSSSLNDWAVMDGFTLRGYTGGSVEAYALKNGISFASIGVVEPPEEPEPEEKEPVLQHDGCLITPTEAVAEMTWGVNLCSLFMTDPNVDGSTIGYANTAPFGLAMWVDGGGFEWLCYNDIHTGTFPVSATIQSCPDSDNDLFWMAAMSTLLNQEFTLTFSNSKLTKTDGTVIPLTSLNGTHELTASNGPDINGWCAAYISLGEELPKSDRSFIGATVSTTVTVNKAEFATTADKVSTLYQLNQEKVDQEELTEVYLEQGCNVFRLPVTWTPFVNDTTFKIDPEWLELVKSEVDYILSRGAYCILNTHSDYLNCSFVGDHWEDQWMDAQYQTYVDARFAAIWKQIAEYFKDYPQQLIFEPFNEPSMAWYVGVDFDNWKLRQADRINGMNQLFVDTVRSTGGGNTTRFLCLPTADYCNHKYLKNLSLPNDPYLMVQLHSYSEMEDNINQSDDPDFDYQAEIGSLFSDVAVFRKRYPDVPVLIGEVGLTQQNDRYAQERVSYFYAQAEANGVPCLWWEDGYTNSFSMYVIKSKTWERSDVLAAIQEQIVEPLRLTVSTPDKDYFLTSTLDGPCTVAAAAYDKDGRFLGCSTAYRESGVTRLALELDLPDCPDTYEVKVFFLDDDTYVPACVPLERN